MKTYPPDMGEFRRSMQGVKPIKYDKVIPHSQQSSTIVATPREYDDSQTDDTEIHNHLIDDNCPMTITASQPFQFARSGIQRRVMQKLKKAQFPLEASLDMHA